MMIAISAVIISSLVFTFFFTIKIFETYLFLTQKPITVNIEKNSKNSIIKKKLELILLKKKKKIQSKIFFAKFLEEKENKNLPLKIKFLIDKIYHRITTNICFLDEFIDFDKLKNAGIFNEKPIFKINVRGKEMLERYFEAFKILNSHIIFRIIFLLDETTDNDLIKDLIFDNLKDVDYKIILLKDINLRLLQEINKLDLNYRPNKINKVETDWNFENLKFENIKTTSNMEEHNSCDKNAQIKLLKFLNFNCNDFKDAKVCYYLKSISKQNKILNFKINYKLKNEFYNIKIDKKNNKKIIINYFNNNLINDEFYFSKKYKKIEKIKENGFIFLIFYFSINFFKEGAFFLISGASEEIENKTQLLKLIYNNNFKIEKYFNLKIYINNGEFNDFFNKKLIKLIINEKLNENNPKNEEILLKYILMLSKIFNIEYKNIVNLKSYFEIYNFILKEVFGIKVKEEIIHINPKREHYDKNFKIIFTDDKDKKHGVYVEQNSAFKGLEVGDVIYSNLKVIDLSLIENNAKFCV